MRRNIAAGNWKMNMTWEEGMHLVEGLKEANIPAKTDMILGVPAIFLKEIQSKINTKSNTYVAAQNCHQAEKGAFTGEISVPMIKSTGATHVILGHSERREYFGESDALILEKVKQVLANDLKVIFCCGEPLQIREAGTQSEYVENQLKHSIFQLSESEMESVIIAYEPIWAIGTGKTASPEQAQEMHAFIRSKLSEKFGPKTAENTSILYGGSVKPANAKEIFAQTDVDGGLVGGASLKADSFNAIVEAF